MASDPPPSVALTPDLPVPADVLAHSHSAPARPVCPRDPHGPRVPELLAHFVRHADAPSHVEWLVKLRVVCETQGCSDATCPSATTSNTNTPFQQGIADGGAVAAPPTAYAEMHGARTLHAAIRPFLTHVVPATGLVVYDSEWGRAVDAMRAFHAFCVDMAHVPPDDNVDDILRKLKRFRPIGIPRNIVRLAQERWWHAVEHDAARIRSRAQGRPGGGGGQPCSAASSGSPQAMLAPAGLLAGADAPGGAPHSLAHGLQQAHAAPAGDVVFERELVGVVSCADDQSQFISIDIRRDGWVLQKMEMRYGRFCGTEPLFLPLPPHVAKMGVKGMTISCMDLGLRNGVWRPLERDGVFIGKAFPPVS